MDNFNPNDIEGSIAQIQGLERQWNKDFNEVHPIITLPKCEKWKGNEEIILLDVANVYINLVGLGDPYFDQFMPRYLLLKLFLNCKEAPYA